MYQILTFNTATNVDELVWCTFIKDKDKDAWEEDFFKDLAKEINLERKIDFTIDGINTTIDSIDISICISLMDEFDKSSYNSDLYGAIYIDEPNYIDLVNKDILLQRIKSEIEKFIADCSEAINKIAIAKIPGIDEILYHNRCFYTEWNRPTDAKIIKISPDINLDNLDM